MRKEKDFLKGCDPIRDKEGFSSSLSTMLFSPQSNPFSLSDQTIVSINTCVAQKRERKKDCVSLFLNDTLSLFNSGTIQG